MTTGGRLSIYRELMGVEPSGVHRPCSASCLEVAARLARASSAARILHALDAGACSGSCPVPPVGNCDVSTSFRECMHCALLGLHSAFRYHIYDSKDCLVTRVLVVLKPAPRRAAAPSRYHFSVASLPGMLTPQSGVAAQPRIGLMSPGRAHDCLVLPSR